MHFWWYTDWYNGTAYPGGSRTPGRCGHDRSPAHTGKQPPSLRRDLLLGQAVADALLDDAEVTGGRIELSVRNGVVILDGEVDTEVTRSAAVAVAWSVTVVTDVCDALVTTNQRHGC